MDKPGDLDTELDCPIVYDTKFLMLRLIIWIVAMLIIMYCLNQPDDKYSVERVDGWDADSYESY